MVTGLQTVYLRGNVLDLAVSVVMGAPLCPLFRQLFKDLITPVDRCYCREAGNFAEREFTVKRKAISRARF